MPVKTKEKSVSSQSEKNTGESRRDRWKRRLFVSNDSPVLLRVIGLLSYFMAVIGFILAQSPGSGVPGYDQLISHSGTVEWARKKRYDIEIRTKSSPLTFTYASKSGRTNEVWDTIYIGAEISVLHKEPTPKLFADIFEISVAGQMIQSYEETRTAWVADDDIGWWLFFAFLMSGSYLFATAHFTQEARENAEK